MFRIRASMLSLYNDCPRRSFSQGFKKMVVNAGFKIEYVPVTIGPAIGTGVHSGIENMMNSKKANGNPGSLKDAQEIAVESFKIQISEGATYDDVTPNKNQGQKQIQIMTKAYFHGLADKIDVLETEKNLKAQINPDFLLTGKLDIYENSGNIRDTKTGKTSKINYIAQAGAYSILKRSQKDKVVKLIQDYIPRVPTTKEYPGCSSSEYVKDQAELAAFGVINTIIRDVKEFMKTGNHRAIPANPNSMMCSKKFCPVYGTDFCEFTKGKK